MFLCVSQTLSVLYGTCLPSLPDTVGAVSGDAPPLTARDIGPVIAVTALCSDLFSSHVYPHLTLLSTIKVHGLFQKVALFLNFFRSRKKRGVSIFHTYTPSNLHGRKKTVYDTVSVCIVWYLPTIPSGAVGAASSGTPLFS